MVCEDISSQRNATIDPAASVPIVYEDFVVFNCKEGFTTTGRADGGTFFFAVCRADQTLAPATDTGCFDVDECLSSPCDHICVNTVGSFFCECFTGFELTSETSCVDIDECAIGSPCVPFINTQCVNTKGSFLCACLPGFTEIGDECRREKFNLLSPLIGTPVGNNPPQRFADDWIFFGGNGALEIHDELPLGVDFSISTQFQLVPGRGGYILAFTSPSGRRRNFALYIYELSQRVQKEF